MIFLETSFLVNFFVEKNKFHEKALEIMEKIKDKSLIITEMTIYETLTVLRKMKKTDKEVNEVYKKLLTLDVYDDKEYYTQALNYTLHENNIGFFDNLTYIFMADTGIKEIASFDEDFDIFNNIKRIS